MFLVAYRPPFVEAALWLTSCTNVHTVEYEWDPAKARANRTKHGISFADAALALEDELALTIRDDRGQEVRYVTMGADPLGRLLVVVHTRRGDAIRIISVRRATRQERQRYEEAI